MRKSVMGLAAIAACLWITRAMSGCVGDDPPANPGFDAGNDANVVKACTKGTDCTSGFCADGVCCDSACGGSCESCNLAGTAGKCSPIPDGQDPDKECTTVSDDGGIPDDATADGAPINLPDGGIALDDTKCGGTCNGKGACGFADSTKTCGSVFCNSTTTQGRAACDSKGHCELGFEACKAYSCPDGTGDAGAASGCLTTCTGDADCQSTHYCDQGTCKPKLANGTACTSVPQCQSAHCVSSVCCNDECQGVGGSCTSSGKVGQCICPACSTGPCKLWYKDGDNDGFGDSTGTLGNGRALAGCASGADGGAPTPPQAGFVQDNTDCFDGLNTVHPGQTAYFTAPYGGSSFDYNCDNVTTKETREFVGGTCGFCSGTSVCSHNATCAVANSQAYYNCYTSIILNQPCYGGFNALQYNTSGFRSAVACGTSSTVYTCGKCSAVNGFAAQTTVAKVQACH